MTSQLYEAMPVDLRIVLDRMEREASALQDAARTMRKTVESLETLAFRLAVCATGIVLAGAVLFAVYQGAWWQGHLAGQDDAGHAREHWMEAWRHEAAIPPALAVQPASPVAEPERPAILEPRPETGTNGEPFRPAPPAGSASIMEAAPPIETAPLARVPPLAGAARLARPSPAELFDLATTLPGVRPHPASSPATAPHGIVFFDPRCPHCHTAWPALRDDGGDLLWIPVAVLGAEDPARSTVAAVLAGRDAGLPVLTAAFGAVPATAAMTPGLKAESDETMAGFLALIRAFPNEVEGVPAYLVRGADGTVRIGSGWPAAPGVFTEAEAAGRPVSPPPASGPAAGERPLTGNSAQGTPEEAPRPEDVR